MGGGLGGHQRLWREVLGEALVSVLIPTCFLLPPPLLKVPTPPPKSWAPKPIVEYNHPLEPDGKKGMEVLLGGKEGGGKKRGVGRGVMMLYMGRGGVHTVTPTPLSAVFVPQPRGWPCPPLTAPVTWRQSGTAGGRS